MDWFSSIQFVTAEWRESARMVLLRYIYRGGSGEVEELGVRLDLDKKAFLDDLEDPTASGEIHQKEKEIWAVVSNEYAKAKN